MSDYIKREGAIGAILDKYVDYAGITDAIKAVPSADVIEVGKPYPREELEKYGLTEWKDKHGQRWVMVERREHEKHIHD